MTAGTATTKPSVTTGDASRIDTSQQHLLRENNHRQCTPSSVPPKCQHKRGSTGLVSTKAADGTWTAATKAITVARDTTKHSSPSATTTKKNPLEEAVEILPGRLYFVALPHPPTSYDYPLPGATNVTKHVHFVAVDLHFVYWNFLLDFGPFNLGQFMRFRNLLKERMDAHDVVCVYTSSVDDAKRANAIHLICCWQMLQLHRTPEQAYAGFEVAPTEAPNVTDEVKDGMIWDCHARNNTVTPAYSTVTPNGSSRPPINAGSATVAPLPSFRDASRRPKCDYDLHVLDFLHGLAAALRHGWLDTATFDVEEYERYERVENGDMNWIIPNRVLALAGPTHRRIMCADGSGTNAPADYIPYFQQRNVGLVVRLNEKTTYSQQHFTDAGIAHLDAFFPDGSCPDLDLLHGILEAFAQTTANGQAFAVHCQAGVGRTGTCIGAYLMKHFGLTAKEAIAWMRMCRPGCVIGDQQHFLEGIQQLMWDEGLSEGYLNRMPGGNWKLENPTKNDGVETSEGDGPFDEIPSALNSMAEATTVLWFLLFGYVLSCSCRAATNA